jgi:hypothetical protein
MSVCKEKVLIWGISKFRTQNIPEETDTLLLKNFYAIYWTHMFIIWLTRVHSWSISLSRLELNKLLTVSLSHTNIVFTRGYIFSCHITVTYVSVCQHYWWETRSLMNLRTQFLSKNTFDLCLSFTTIQRVMYYSLLFRVEVQVSLQYCFPTNSVALVRERTIPTELPQLVGEVSANLCG